MNNKRREKIKTAIGYVEKVNDIIEDVLYESEDARDNLPENLYGSSLYDRLDEECDMLSCLINDVDDVKVNLEELL